MRDAGGMPLDRLLSTHLHTFRAFTSSFLVFGVFRGFRQQVLMKIMRSDKPVYSFVVFVLCMRVLSSGTVWAMPLVFGMSAKTQSELPSNMLTVVHGRPDPLEQELSEVVDNLTEFQPQAAPRQVEDFMACIAKPFTVVSQSVHTTPTPVEMSSAIETDTPAVPEPSTLFSLGLGVAALIGIWRQKYMQRKGQGVKKNV